MFFVINMILRRCRWQEKIERDAQDITAELSGMTWSSIDPIRAILISDRRLLTRWLSELLLRLCWWIHELKQLLCSLGLEILINEICMKNCKTYIHTNWTPTVAIRFLINEGNGSLEMLSIARTQHCWWPYECAIHAKASEISDEEFWSTWWWNSGSVV
jgi:hypothetical protein